ncbi:hypothetical protein ACHWQZ_G009863 [Mnemiopsis leidyi]
MPFYLRTFLLNKPQSAELPVISCFSNSLLNCSLRYSVTKLLSYVSFVRAVLLDNISTVSYFQSDEMETLLEPSSYFPCKPCQTRSIHSFGLTLPCGVERYYNNFVLKRSAVEGKRGRKGGEREEEKVARVFPSIDGITGVEGNVELMFDHLTGTVKHIDGRKVLQQYQGKEVELLLKIQVPWSLMGPLMNEDLMAYNKDRDFRVTIKNSDRDCRGGPRP